MFVKEIIDKREHGDFEEALNDVQNVYNAGFYADLTCVDVEPVGFGINVGTYYVVDIFKWKRKEDD